MSVRTQPGQTELIANFGNAAASCTVTPLSAVFEMQYAGAQPSAPSVNWPPPLETFTMRGVEFEGPPQKQPWGTYAMFKDSEGNRFVVSS
jgi:hypothetical protein